MSAAANSARRASSGPMIASQSRSSWITPDLPPRRSAAPARPPGVDRAGEGTTGILLHLDSGKYFGLNDVGTRIWTLIAAHHTLQGVLTCLEEEFEATPEVLKHDLLQLTGDLTANGLLAADEAGLGA